MKSLKNCSFCRELKPLTEFYYSKSNRSFFAECKLCFKSRASLDYQERKMFGPHRPKLDSTVIEK